VLWERGDEKGALSAAAILSESKLVIASYCYDVVFSAKPKIESKVIIVE